MILEQHGPQLAIHHGPRCRPDPVAPTYDIPPPSPAEWAAALKNYRLIIYVLVKDRHNWDLQPYPEILFQAVVIRVAYALRFFDPNLSKLSSYIALVAKREMLGLRKTRRSFVVAPLHTRKKAKSYTASPFLLGRSRRLRNAAEPRERVDEEIYDRLTEALRYLPTVLRETVDRFYGLSSREPMTLRAVRELFAARGHRVSSARMSQYLQEGLALLRSRLSYHGPLPCGRGAHAARMTRNKGSWRKRKVET